MCIPGNYLYGAHVNQYLWESFVIGMFHLKNEIKSGFKNLNVSSHNKMSKYILCDPMDYSLPGSFVWNSPGTNTILHGISPTQGSNPGLPHCRQILYHLSYWGSSNLLFSKVCFMKHLFWDIVNRDFIKTS